MSPELTALLVRLDKSASSIAFDCRDCAQSIVEARDSAAALRAMHDTAEKALMEAQKEIAALKVQS